ncbi:MAG: hypothetical protein KIT43_06105 [Bauldia sp.]|nr:hypothetical protein [Bauldia sp.]
MRMMRVGLDTPTAGQVPINCRPTSKLPATLVRLGTLLEATAVHPPRSPRNHLLALAEATGIPF